MTEIVDRPTAVIAIDDAAVKIQEQVSVLEDARRLAPSRELSVAITEIETGLLWLDKANR